MSNVPIPKYHVQRKQAILGNTVISSYIFIIIILTKIFVFYQLDYYSVKIYESIGYFFAFLVFLSLIIIHYSDPGIIPPIPCEPFDGMISISGSRDHPTSTQCHRCHIWRPFRTHHCSICSRCIKGFDHHCQYLGRCIGSQNRRYFILLFFSGGCANIPVVLSTLQVLYNPVDVEYWVMVYLTGFFGFCGSILCLSYCIWLLYHVILGKTKYYTDAFLTDYFHFHSINFIFWNIFYIFFYPSGLISYLLDYYEKGHSSLDLNYSNKKYTVLP